MSSALLWGSCSSRCCRGPAPALEYETPTYQAPFQRLELTHDEFQKMLRDVPELERLHDEPEMFDREDLYRFRGKRFVELILLAPVIVPAIAVSMGIQVMFIRYGLADTIPGVVLVHVIPTIPYVVLVMGAVFANYDSANRVCLGDGSGGFSCADVSADLHETREIATGLVDGDANLDLLFANPGINRVCLGDGDGRFACSDAGGKPADTYGVALGELGTPLLFSDGFESGDTSAWTRTVP